MGAEKDPNNVKFISTTRTLPSQRLTFGGTLQRLDPVLVGEVTDQATGGRPLAADQGLARLALGLVRGLVGLKVLPYFRRRHFVTKDVIVYNRHQGQKAL